MDGMQVMFKNCMDANKHKKDKEKDLDKDKTFLVCQGINSKGYPITYWYTHSITKNLRHNRIACKRTCEGHNKEATLQNKMGGSPETTKNTIDS